MDKRVEEWLDKHEGDDYCNYCKFRMDCKGITCGPRGPYFPPCADGNVEDYIDEDELLEAIEDGDEDI